MTFSIGLILFAIYGERIVSGSTKAGMEVFGYVLSILAGIGIGGLFIGFFFHKES
jgi:hypothetical protein